MNIVLGIVLVIVLRSLIHIYGSILIGFAVLPAFIFMFILIMILANHSIQNY